MEAKICNGCGVRLDDGGVYYSFQMFHMKTVGEIHESEQVRDLCLVCEAKLRPALDVIDAGTKP